MKRWIFILTITFSVVQISDGIFGRKKTWNVPTMPPNGFDSPDWLYRRQPIGNSIEYDEPTTTPYPFMHHNPKPGPRGFPKLELSCFGCGGSSSDNDIPYDGCEHKPKKGKPKKKPKQKNKHKKHKKHHKNNKGDDLWGPKPPVGYELPNTNDIWE